MTGLEQAALITLLGPFAARTGSTAATKASGFVFGGMRDRLAARQTRKTAISAGPLVRHLTTDLGLTPDSAAGLHAYLRSPDFANLSLKLAIELLPLTAKSRLKATETSVIRLELLIGLTKSTKSIDSQLVDTLAAIIYGEMAKAILDSPALVNLPSSTPPETRAHAVRIAGFAAAASARNAEILGDLESLSDFWKSETKLRAQVRATHSTMKLPHAGATRRVPYNKLFVEPRLIGPASGSSEKFEIPNLQEANDASMHPWDIKDLLSSAGRAIVLGNPGGGKSTMALKLSHDVAGSPQSIDSPNVPLLVVLRDYAEAFQSEKLTLVSHLESLCRSPYNVEPPPGFVEYMLLNGRCLVVFDGLDELVDVSLRKRLVENIESFANMYPTTTILVTSRLVGYEEAALDASLFAAFQLASLGPSQVADYVGKWFALDDSVDKDRRERLAQGFIADSAFVSDLRQNPLMLSLMCGIYSSEHYIPANRPEVYRKCAELLFERWDKQRGIITPLPFDAHVRRALNALAYWTYSRTDGQSGLKRDVLVRFMTDYLREKRFADEGEAENAAVQFIDFCTGRAWVLTDVGSDRQQELYGFTHRTFLEYFAANQIARLNPSARKLFEALRRRIVAAEWEVVSQLALQILGVNVEDGSDDFLDLVLAAHARERSLRQARNLLAFAARSTAFVVPRPSTLSALTVAALDDSIRSSTSSRNDATKTRAVSAIDELHQCSQENLPDVSRLIRNNLVERLASDPSNERALVAALSCGGGDPLSRIDNIQRTAYWRQEVLARLELLEDAIRVQSATTPWVGVTRALIGQGSMAEMLQAHGPACLYVYMTGPYPGRGPLAYRHWMGPTTDDWLDLRIAECVTEVVQYLLAIDAPWLHVSSKSDQILATARVFSDRHRAVPPFSDPASVLMALPIAEIVTGGVAGRQHALNLGEHGTMAQCTVPRLVAARFGDQEAASAVWHEITSWNPPTQFLDLVKAWINREASLVAFDGEAVSDILPWLERN